MIRIETREQIRALVNEYPEGISLTKLHGQLYRVLTRLQLRTALTMLYIKGEISRERVTELNRRLTKYYPFNGQAPVKRVKRKIIEKNNRMLSRKDFMPGKKYAAYLDF